MKEWIKSFFIGNGWVGGFILVAYLLFKGMVFLFSLPVTYSCYLFGFVLMIIITISTHQARADKRSGRTTDRMFPG